VINRDSINHFCYKEELYLYQQDYLYSNLGELLNRHIFLDTSNTVGHVIVELLSTLNDSIRCVIVSVLTSSKVSFGFNPQSGQTKKL
jgi:hypothetical protein